MENVPAPVRAFLVSPERNRIVLALVQKHRLHVDQGAVLERDLIFMLLGIITPAEFAESLQKSGVPQETLASLVRDVNEQIFVRLRKKEQTEGVTPAPKIIGVSPVSPIKAVSVQTANVRTMQSDIAEMKGAPHAAPRIIMPTATAAPLRPNMIVHPPLPTPEATTSRPAPMISQPETIATRFEPPPLSSRPVPPPPPNLPGVAASTTFQSSSIPAQKEPVAPVPFPKPLQTPSAVPASKTYNTDPYREPMDETKT